MTEVLRNDDPFVAMVADRIDWQPTCLEGGERRAIVRQILEFAQERPVCDWVATGLPLGKPVLTCVEPAGHAPPHRDPDGATWVERPQPTTDGEARRRALDAVMERAPASGEMSVADVVDALIARPDVLAVLAARSAPAAPARALVSPPVVRDEAARWLPAAPDPSEA